mmetsp:Transcript_38223/g.94813  ORF Transcript_38223/g.94813 Transcript_38223/m.94813 type:complete len:216 (+) Transcript_38223:1075-1722(+)
MANTGNQKQDALKNCRLGRLPFPLPCMVVNTRWSGPNSGNGTIQRPLAQRMACTSVWRNTNVSTSSTTTYCTPGGMVSYSRVRRNWEILNCRSGSMWKRLLTSEVTRHAPFTCTTLTPPPSPSPPPPLPPHPSPSPPPSASFFFQETRGNLTPPPLPPPEVSLCFPPPPPPPPLCLSLFTLVWCGSDALSLLLRCPNAAENARPLLRSRAHPARS